MSNVFELKYPIEVKGVEVSKLSPRRPKVRDIKNFIKNLERDGVGAIEKVLGDLCDVDEKIITELDLEDFGPLKTWFEGFLKHMQSESTES